MSQVLTITRHSQPSLTQTEMQQALADKGDFFILDTQAWGWLGAPAGETVCLNLEADRLWTDGSDAWLNAAGITKLQQLATRLGAELRDEEGDFLDANSITEILPKPGRLSTLFLAVLTLPLMLLLALLVLLTVLIVSFPWREWRPWRRAAKTGQVPSQESLAPPDRISVLHATLRFCDPNLQGADLGQVAEHYRPLMALPQGLLSSCFFNRIGPGSGSMALGVDYEVELRLPMRAMIEEHLALPTNAIWPPGGPLRLLVVPDRTVAEGVIHGVQPTTSANDHVPHP